MYDLVVRDRSLTPAALAAILERFPVERATSKEPSEVVEQQLQMLYGRLAALTDAIRDVVDDDTARLASRLLLSDLATVAAHFRGRANALRPALAQALEELRPALQQCDAARAGEYSSTGPQPRK